MKLLFAHIQNARTFSILMGSFVTEDKIFGPPNIEKFKQGTWERSVKGRLADCDVAMLDEIMKTNQGALNSMLDVLHERVYEGNKVPLWVAGSASNWPEVRARSENVEALWDRFVLRCPVSRIDDEGRAAMLEKVDAIEGYQPQATFTVDELRAASDEAKAIEFRPRIVKALVEVVARLEKGGLRVSDRRVAQMRRVLQASAWLAERKTVMLDDFQALRFGLWEEEVHLRQFQVVIDSIDHDAYKRVIKLLRQALDDTGNAANAKATEAADIAGKCVAATRDAGAILREHELTTAHMDEARGMIAQLQERFKSMRGLIDSVVESKGKQPAQGA